MATKKQKMRSPSEVRSLNQVCELERDNFSTRKSWMSVNPDGSVSIYNQMSGKSATGNISLARTELLKLAHWYTKPQRIVKRP
jgi:hypothetical protein